VFSFIGIVLLGALTSPVRYFGTVASKEDSALLAIINSVFCFVDLRREDASVVCNFKC